MAKFRLSQYIRKERLQELMDLLVGTLSFYLAVLIAGNAAMIAPHVDHGSTIALAMAYAVAMLMGLVAMGSYPDDSRDIFPGIILRLGASFLFGNLLLAGGAYVFPFLYIDRTILFLAQIFSLIGICFVRFFALSSFGHQIFVRRILVLGTGNNAQNLMDTERHAYRRGCEILGFVEVPGTKRVVSEDWIIQLHCPLVDFVAEQRVNEIVVALDERRGAIPIDSLIECKAKGIPIFDIIGFFEREFGKLRLDLISPSYLIFSDGFRHDSFFTPIKRATDIALSSLAILIALPIMAITALAIIFEDGWRSPIIYRQTRVGENGQLFKMLKFRSMCVDAEADRTPRWAAVDDRRITRVGAFIRKHRIDELPQLFNVWRGDMSFVGPRPERPEFVRALSEKIPYYSQRHRVKAGISGWAQLCYPYGDSEADAAEKLQYDLYYTKNRSLSLDLLILLKTTEVVLFGKGAR